MTSLASRRKRTHIANKGGRTQFAPTTHLRFTVGRWQFLRSKFATKRSGVFLDAAENECTPQNNKKQNRRFQQRQKENNATTL